MPRSEPSRRREPPRPPRTGLGTEDQRSYLVAIHLADPDEANALVIGFRKLGWSVLTVASLPSDRAAKADIVVTDDPNIAFMREAFGWTESKPSVVVLSPDDEEEIRLAWDCGADWVLQRPVDPDDPLGLQDVGIETF